MPRYTEDHGSSLPDRRMRRRGTERRLLDTHGRWQSPTESMLKLGGVSWLLASFLSWLLLNAYLREIGQRGIPLD